MKPETLHDRLLRASYRPASYYKRWLPGEGIRDILTRARRFVLTPEMSTFLGDLACQAFTNPNGKACERIIENLRMSARLPHDAIWVEFDLRRYTTRATEILRHDIFKDVTDTPQYEGWLITRHPHLETAFLLQIISGDPTPDEEGCDTWIFPVAYGWTVDMDTVLPWPEVDLLDEKHPDYSSSVLATGLQGYITRRIGLCHPPMVKLGTMEPGTLTNLKRALLKEWVGVLRRVFAFLATVNDLPVQVTGVRQNQGGFVARGRHRRYLNHHTIHLTVPAQRYRTLARKALAAMHSRAGGPVRGHFRKDWRRPYSVFCEHVYAADETHRWCTICEGRHSWVHDHVRGDTSVGFTTTDYVVATPKEGVVG